MKGRIKRVVRFLALVTLGSFAISQFCASVISARPAQAQDATDTRERIRVTAAERDAVVREMRTMLESISRIVHGLAAGDMGTVEKAAEAAGTATAVDPALKKKLPPQFLQTGTKTHQRFDQLATAAKQGVTRDDILKRLAAITGYCVACHATYRLEEAR